MEVSRPASMNYALDQHDQRHHPHNQAKLDHVIQRPAPVLQLAPVLAGQPDEAEQLVDGAGLVAVVVGRTGGGHHGLAEPAVDGLGPAPAHWALDVAEQDDAVAVAAVVGPVDEGFVEYHGLAVAPAVALAVDFDEAFVV